MTAAIQSANALHPHNHVCVTRRAQTSQARGGVTIVETVVSTVLLAAALSLSVGTVATVHAQQRELDRRRCALQEASNVIEMLMVADPRELDSERLAEFDLSPTAGERLPSGVINIEISESTGQPTARRVVVEVQWRNDAGRMVSPARLTAWIY